MKRCCLPIIVLLLTSCGNNKQTSPAYVTQTIEKAAATKNEGGGNCLQGYASKYNELLTLEEAANIVRQPAAEAKARYSKVLKNSVYHDITYKWKGEGNMQVGGYTVPRQNYIKLTGIKSCTVQEFNQSYTPKTEEEIAQLQQTLNKETGKAIAGVSGEKEANNAMDKVKKTGMSDQEIKRATGGVTGTLLKSLKHYELVAGLADMASWNSMTKELVVLKEGTKFNLEINLSNNDNVNKEAAIQAANIILKKCN